jgi:membrane-bound metal-dependent hydrolase YbcI (DUF457 family)
MLGAANGSMLVTMFISLLGAVIDLNEHPRYLHSGWFLISVANLVVIVAMVAVFAVAIFVPFPRGEKRE